MIEYTVKVYDNRTEWYLNDKLHREDGPAVEWNDGDKEWFINGEIHREDGPAVECSNGDKIWHLNGKLHREDGPACEYASGNKWYIDGEEMTEKEFLEKTQKHTVTIDGEILEISNKSYEELKKVFAE